MRLITFLIDFLRSGNGPELYRLIYIVMFSETSILMQVFLEDVDGKRWVPM